LTRFEQAVEAMGLHVPMCRRASKWTLRFHVAEGLSLPAVQVDGELFPPAEQAEIEVMPRALRLVVPCK
jgi:diacylglycerol kinase family enzyme